MSQLCLAPGRPNPFGLLSSTTDINSIVVAAGSAKQEISHVRATFTASAVVGTRTLVLTVKDADGVTIQSRALGSVVASGSLVVAAPFSYPYPYQGTGEEVVVGAPIRGAYGLVLGNGWTITVEDTADIDGAGDALVVGVYGRNLRS